MPLYLEMQQSEFRLAVWRISEEIAFFESGAIPVSEISNRDKRRQWVASRFLVNHLYGGAAGICKDEFGKPYIEGHSGLQISLTHTAAFTAVMLSAEVPVGVDMEAVHPKVERIAPKFLELPEIEAIPADVKTETLILYWSAKEALYKLYGRKQLDFKTQIRIAPFLVNKEGVLTADVLPEGEKINGLKVHYRFFEDHVLTYVVGR